MENSEDIDLRGGAGYLLAVSERYQKRVGGLFWTGLGKRVQGAALAIDPRLLILLVSALGSLAWLLPWPALYFFLPLSLLCAAAAYTLLPGGRKAILAYCAFVLFWGLSYFLLHLWENWGAMQELASQHSVAHGEALSAQASVSALVYPIVGAACVFAARLFCIFGLAAALALALTPLTMGRALAWYLGRLAIVEAWFCRVVLRGRVRPRLADAAWRAGLGLTVMAAFLPRTFRALRGLSGSLRLRAPHLPLYRRLTLIGLAALRLLGSQTWEMSVAIASRGLYQPEPWAWRRPARRS